MTDKLELYRQKGFQLFRGIVDDDKILEAQNSLIKYYDTRTDVGFCQIPDDSEDTTLIYELNNACKHQVLEVYKEIYGHDTIALLHGPDRISIKNKDNNILSYHIDTKFFPEAKHKFSKYNHYDGKYDVRVQGVLFLTNCEYKQGGTMLIPYSWKKDVHNKIRELFPQFKKVEMQYMYNRIPYSIIEYVIQKLYLDLKLTENIFVPETIKARRGDLLLFDQRIIHGNTYVFDDSTRMAAYIRYFPVG